MGCVILAHQHFNSLCILSISLTAQSTPWCPLRQPARRWRSAPAIFGRSHWCHQTAEVLQVNCQRLSSGRNVSRWVRSGLSSSFIGWLWRFGIRKNYRTSGNWVSYTQYTKRATGWTVQISEPVLNAAYKILSQILFCRLTPLATNFIGSYQAGFVGSKSTTDQIFTLRQILQKC